MFRFGTLLYNLPENCGKIICCECVCEGCDFVCVKIADICKPCSERVAKRPFLQWILIMLVIQCITLFAVIVTGLILVTVFGATKCPNYFTTNCYLDGFVFWLVVAVPFGIALTLFLQAMISFLIFGGNLTSLWKKLITKCFDIDQSQTEINDFHQLENIVSEQ